ncbi:MAG: LamG domain-containing protein, partial [Thermoplasmata archaeon]|nr:LamG domain-containing protein [Thermoplasmata archaeon]
MKAISFVLFLFLFAGMTGIGYASDFTSVKVGSSEVWNRYYSFHLLNESEECRYISISLSQVNRTHIRADMTVDPLFLADLVACAGLNGNAKMNCFQAAATKYNISYAALVQDFKSFPIGYNGIQQALSDLTAYGTATIYLPLPSRGAKIKFGWNSETWNVSYPSNQSYTNNVTPSVTFRVYGNETTYNCTIFWNNTAYGSNETTANYTYTTITTNSNLADGAYLGYVNCSTPSEINQSGTYTLTVDTLIPGIWFSDPTLSDGNITPNNYSYVNISTSTEEDGLSVVNTWGLVGWWGWNQETGTKTVIDESGNGNTGNRTNMATNSTVEGYYGRGQSFDGVDDGIIIPINGKSVNITSAITIEGWFYIRIATTASLVATGKFGTAYPGFSLAYYGPSNGIEWDINNETGGRGTLYKTNLVYINTWYYIVALWDGTNNSGSQRLYVNGIQVDSGTAQIQHITNTNNLKIGQEISLYSLNGSLDEVRIYNRALSAAEINASYNANLFKYANNFTNLSDGNYSFQGYVIDRAGNINTTGLRSILINSTYTGTTTTTT